MCKSDGHIERLLGNGGLRGLYRCGNGVTLGKDGGGGGFNGREGLTQYGKGNEL